MEKGYSFFKKAGLAAFAIMAFTFSGTAAQLEVTTTEPGTLASLISENDKWNTTELKVSGPINAIDIRTLREMAGSDYYGEPTEGKLQKLDMTDVEIIGYDESTPSVDQSYFCDTMQGFVYLIAEDNKTVLDNILYSKDLKTLYYCPSGSPQTTIRTPDATEIIYKYAFYSNQHVQSVEMPNVKEIKSPAFTYCAALQQLSFGNQLTTLEEMSIFGNFQLSSVTVAADNPHFKNTGNFLTDTSGKNLYIFAADNTVETCDVPDGVETVCTGAIFSNYIHTVNFPNSVTTLQRYAISNCLKLETINMGSGITNLEQFYTFNLTALQEYNMDSANPNYSSYGGALYSKDGLTLVVIPEGRTEFSVKEGAERLGTYSLGVYSNSIEKLTLPASLKTLTSLTLSCNNLKEIYCKATVPPTSNDYLPFYPFMSNNIDLFVPTGCANAYKTASCWKDFKSVNEFDFSGIESVTAGEKPYEVARYGIDGKQLPAEAPGLNLIKMSDGTVQKVWVSDNR